MSLINCKFMDNAVNSNSYGDLTVTQLDDQFNFPIRRQYVIQNCPAGSERGFHAHRNLWQYFICLVGSVDIYLWDGVNTAKFTLNNPKIGLVVGPMVWREIKVFSDDTVLSVLASEVYDESDYIRDRSVFEELTRK